MAKHWILLPALCAFAELTLVGAFVAFAIRYNRVHEERLRYSKLETYYRSLRKFWSLLI